MSSWLGNFLGGGPDALGSSLSLQQLLQRLQTQWDHLPADQKKLTVAQLKEAVSASLSAPSPQTHSLIGSLLPHLVRIIKTEKADVEMLRDSVEVMLACFSMGGDVSAPLPLESPQLKHVANFTEVPNNVHAVLELLEESDPTLRYNTTQVLRSLANRIQPLQQCILMAPMGIARMMDLLREREIVRNEALLLLLQITRSNQEIQKIVAFEGAFDSALTIVADEGFSDGGIIVQDCLHLVNNLLKGNISNQNYFRETSCIKRIPPLLEMSTTDMWILTDDKIETIILTLELISILVHGTNQNAQTNQAVLRTVGILDLILPLALGKLNSAKIRTKALFTLGSLLMSNKDNTNYFSSQRVQVDQASIPSLDRLLYVALNAQPIAEREAAVRVFKCYLHENEEAQVALASTLTPPPTQGTLRGSIGTELLNALFEWEGTDEMKSWYAAIILSFIIRGNSLAKDLILKISLEVRIQGAPEITLLTRCMQSMTMVSKMSPTTRTFLVQMGVLRLLNYWLESSASAVKAFLSYSANLPFVIQAVISSHHYEGSEHIQGLSALLIGQCLLYQDENSTAPDSFNKAAIQGIITDRIGKENFIGQLEVLRKTDHFVRAEQGKATIDSEDVEETALAYYDNDFSDFFKSTLNTLSKQLKSPKASKMMPTSTSGDNRKQGEGSTAASGTATSSQYQDTIVASYKDLIRRQDLELDSVTRRNKELEALLEEAKRGVRSSSTAEVEGLRRKLEEKERHQRGLEARITELENQSREVGTTREEAHEDTTALLAKLRELELHNVQKDQEIQQLKRKQDEPKAVVQKQGNVAQVEALLKENEALNFKLRECEQELTSQKQMYASLENEQEELLVSLADLEIESTNLKARLSLLEPNGEQF